MLDQDALELEGTDPVVARFEDVVGPADIGDAAVGVAHADVAGAVDAVAGGLDGAVVAEMALHQPGGGGAEGDGDLALLDLRAVRINEPDVVAGGGEAHGAGGERLAGGVAAL